MIRKKEFEYFSNVKKRLWLLLFLFLATFLFGTISFSFIKQIPFSESFLITVEILTFTHEASEIGAAHLIKILLLLFGGFVIWFTLWTSLDLVLESHFQRYFKEVRIMNQIKKLKDHFVICGAGRVGMHVAEILKAKNIPHVLIEKDEHLVNDAEKKGFLVVDDDALEEQALLDANTHKAKALIAVLPETEKNILIILTAREINPNLKIYARADRKEYIPKLKNAGADHVFMPEYACAEDITQKIFVEESIK